LIKGLKDSDFSLVSGEKMNKTLPSCDWAQGPMISAKKA